MAGGLRRRGRPVRPAHDPVRGLVRLGGTEGPRPNRAQYPYFYYRHTIPPGMAGVYNAPGYCGNGLCTYLDGLLQSIMVAPVSPRPTHPYVHQHSPGTGGRVYDPDPVAANGCGNMMYRGYFLEQLAHPRRISGDAKHDEPFDLVYAKPHFKWHRNG